MLYSDVRFLELDKYVLVGINWSVWGPSRWFGSALSKVTDRKIKYNTFTEMTYPKFDFSGSSITCSMFAKVDLSGSSLFKNRNSRQTRYFLSRLVYQIPTAAPAARTAMYFFFICHSSVLDTTFFP